MKTRSVLLFTLFLFCVLLPRQSHSADSLNDVWMRHGGARLYYDALLRPQQIHMNGARWEDPAFNLRLPPLHPQTPQRPRRPAPAQAVQPHATPPQAAPATPQSASGGAGVGALPAQTGTRLTLPQEGTATTNNTTPTAPTALPASSPTSSQAPVPPPTSTTTSQQGNAQK